MPSKKTIIFITFGLFLLLFSVRFIHLSADPPYDLSTSGGPYGDPGGYSFNARNKLLYGTTKVDNYNMMYMSYLPHLATLWTFKVFGIGYAQMNLVPVFFSCLILIIFFLLLKERFNETLALLGAALLGMNYLFLMFSRVANRIMPALFFFVLGLYLLQKGKKKPWWVVAAGVSFAVAILSKSVLFYALFAVLAGYFLYLVFNVRIKHLVQHITFLFLGALIPFIPFFIFLYLPYREFTHASTTLLDKAGASSPIYASPIHPGCAVFPDALEKIGRQSQKDAYGRLDVFWMVHIGNFLLFYHPAASDQTFHPPHRPACLSDYRFISFPVFHQNKRAD